MAKNQKNQGFAAIRDVVSSSRFRESRGDGTLECRDTGHTLQMLELFLNEETLLFQMCNCIEANKKAGIYDGAYKAVELAAAESR